jgi:kynurenine formamidase
MVRNRVLSISLLMLAIPIARAQQVPLPLEIIDLGALVTEDLPERVWGRAILSDQGWYEEQNRFDVEIQEQELPGGTVSVSNSYYRFFNHGGPHVDAPNHIGLPGGLDSYPIEAFVGPLKVFDVSEFPIGRTVEVDFFKQQDIDPGDIVLIYTGYVAPSNATDYPANTTMTREAALYLAGIPIKAVGTDAHSLYTYDDDRPIEAETALGRVAPVHEVFLSRRIPIYEELFNVDQLLDKSSMLFTGAPLNIENGDGMMVRPVVFVY